MAPKYPKVVVSLSGFDGNAFIILGACQKAAKKQGLPTHEIDAFYKEATSGDYNHLIQTVMRWFTCH